MNVMSGLIAHNRDDLEELRRRGDRNYYEFTLQRSKNAQRVGPVQMSLNKTDPKKAKYTLTVVADDKTIEKKDKTSGEPVQFYVKGSSRMAPYEIVVFDVGKNQITGYLATPKEGGASAPTAATPAPAATPTKPKLRRVFEARLFDNSLGRPCSAFWKHSAGQGFCVCGGRASIKK